MCYECGAAVAVGFANWDLMPSLCCTITLLRLTVSNISARLFGHICAWVCAELGVWVILISYQFITLRLINICIRVWNNFPLVGLAPMQPELERLGPVRPAPEKPPLERLIPARPAPVKLAQKTGSWDRLLENASRVIFFASAFPHLLLRCCVSTAYTERNGPCFKFAGAKIFHTGCSRKPASCVEHNKKTWANKKIPFAHSHTHAHIHLYGLLLGSFFAYSVARHSSFFIFSFCSFRRVFSSFVAVNLCQHCATNVCSGACPYESRFALQPYTHTAAQLRMCACVPSHACACIYHWRASTVRVLVGCFSREFLSLRFSLVFLTYSHTISDCASDSAELPPSSVCRAVRVSVWICFCFGCLVRLVSGTSTFRSHPFRSAKRTRIWRISLFCAPIARECQRAMASETF